MLRHSQELSKEAHKPGGCPNVESLPRLLSSPGIMMRFRRNDGALMLEEHDFFLPVSSFKIGKAIAKLDMEVLWVFFPDYAVFFSYESRQRAEYGEVIIVAAEGMPYLTGAHGTGIPQVLKNGDYYHRPKIQRLAEIYGAIGVYRHLTFFGCLDMIKIKAVYGNRKQAIA